MGTQRNVGGFLVVDLYVDESLVITPPAGSLANQKITVTLQAKSGKRARFKVEADDDVLVERQGNRAPQAA